MTSSVASLFIELREIVDGHENARLPFQKKYKWSYVFLFSFCDSRYLFLPLIFFISLVLISKNLIGELCILLLYSQ